MYHDSNLNSRILSNGSSAAPINSQSTVLSRAASFNSGQVLSQRKLFTESQIGRPSFQKLLEPTPPQWPGLAPYRIVLGHVKDKVLLCHLRDISIMKTPKGLVTCPVLDFASK